MIKLWLHYETNVRHKIYNKIFVICIFLCVVFGLFVGLMTITKTLKGPTFSIKKSLWAYCMYNVL